MLTNALTTTLALALAIPGGVLAIDAANDTAVPGISTSEFFREHGAAFGRNHGSGHSAEHQTHAHSDAKHGHGHDANHTQMSHNGTHGQSHSGGHAKASHSGHGGDRSVQLVARCLASDNRTDEDCIEFAGRLANATVAAVAACMDSDEPRQCYAEQDAPKSSHAPRIAHCIEQSGAESCAETYAKHLLCHGARIAGVDSPIDCPVRDHKRQGDATAASDDTAGDDDTTTASDDA